MHIVDLRQKLAHAKVKQAEEDAAERARLHKLKTGYDLIPRPKEYNFSVINAMNLASNPQLFLRLRVGFLPCNSVELHRSLIGS